MRIKWSCDVDCIIDENWIPWGTREAVGTRHWHEVATHAHTLGECLIPCLFIN
jgi:hypothetical protein